jgi:hypothetical protein
MIPQANHRLDGLQATLTRAPEPSGLSAVAVVAIAFAMFVAGLALGALASAQAALP